MKEFEHNEKWQQRLMDDAELPKSSLPVNHENIWKGIALQQKRTRKISWLPWGIAASLLLGIAWLWINYPSTQNNYRLAWIWKTVANLPAISTYPPAIQQTPTLLLPSTPTNVVAHNDQQNIHTPSASIAKDVATEQTMKQTSIPIREKENSIEIVQEKSIPHNTTIGQLNPTTKQKLKVRYLSEFQQPPMPPADEFWVLKLNERMNNQPELKNNPTQLKMNF